MGLEGLGKLKNSTDLIGNRTRDLPACSIVPQQITLTLAPNIQLVTTLSKRNAKLKVL
jgi:hypothetical protein